MSQTEYSLQENTSITDFSKRFETIRNYTEHLCSNFSEDDHMLQADFFVSPPKWHLAHTTWFFEEMILKSNGKNYEIFDETFSLLFNSYYETIGKRIARDKRHLISRPSLKEALAFRSHVNSGMKQLIENGASKELLELAELGLQHEHQHQELLLTDLKYSLYQSPMYPNVSKTIDLVGQKNTEAGWLEVEEGIYEIGHTGKEFCFDNELGQHRVFLEPFQFRKSLVTNGEFIEFMESGGYEQFKHWHDEGWAWIQGNEIAKPLYWQKVNDVWHQYTYNGLRPVNPEEILTHISFFEAAAFAQWKGMRLPTEFEWEAASNHFHWGDRWEWTNSAYLAYPGFKTSEGAVGEYNGKFMINQMVLRGASKATSQSHSRKTYRNFFPTDARWQCTGIRLAK